jgi:hypothetical protein
MDAFRIIEYNDTGHSGKLELHEMLWTIAGVPLHVWCPASRAVPSPGIEKTGRVWNLNNESGSALSEIRVHCASTTVWLDPFAADKPLPTVLVRYRMWPRVTTQEELDSAWHFFATVGFLPNVAVVGMNRLMERGEMTTSCECGTAHQGQAELHSIPILVALPATGLMTLSLFMRFYCQALACRAHRYCASRIGRHMASEPSLLRACIPRQCAHCAKLETVPIAAKLLACRACLTVHYCSQECQRVDWKAHKPLCALIVKIRELDKALD